MATFTGIFTGTFEGTFTSDGAPPDAEQPPEIPPIPNNAVWCPKGVEPATVLGQVPPGGTLVIEDGCYYQPLPTDNDGITIRSASGNPYACYFDGRGGHGGGHDMAWGKGMIYAYRSMTVLGIGLRNCGSPASGTGYSNEGGVWIGDTDYANVESVSVWVQRCALDNCGNGVFAAGEPRISVRVAECIFGYIAPNGQNASLTSGGGPAHDNYLQCGQVEVSHSYFYGCANGHNVKSRAAVSDVYDNPCMVQDGGRVFEAADGGEAAFERNTVYTRTDRQGAHYGNSNMLAYCSEGQGNGAGTMSMAGNTLHVSRSGSTIWAAAGAIQAFGDAVHCYGDGTLRLEGNVQGIEGTEPGSGSAPSLPQPPSWARPP